MGCDLGEEGVEVRFHCFRQAVDRAKGIQGEDWLERREDVSVLS